jgi:acetyltransferase-like isoleucine patch superfamily enzyme
VVIESGVSIEAVRSVRIGARSLLGAFSMILDNSFHQLEGDRMARPRSYPVVIEEEVLVGPRSILLPGTHLGRGTRVGPCTVLSRRTPPGATVSGHPAVIRMPA